MQNAEGYRELTLERILEITDVSSQRVLLSILGRLCEAGLLVEHFRVHDVEGMAVEDFPSLEEVPETVTDWRSGREMSVDLDMLRMIYTVPKAS